jgi:hypothetical protein
MLRARNFRLQARAGGGEGRGREGAWRGGEGEGGRERGGGEGAGPGCRQTKDINMPPPPPPTCVIRSARSNNMSPATFLMTQVCVGPTPRPLVQTYCLSYRGGSDFNVF